MEKNRQPVLSICIPTYQRREPLGRTLDALMGIAEKCSGGVEICVSDNGSTDGTHEMLEKRAAANHLLRIRRNRENMGFDANLLEALRMAKGRYCWTVGDDDTVFEGAIIQLARKLGEKDYAAGLIASGTPEGARQIAEFFPQGEYPAAEFLRAYGEYVKATNVGSPAFGFMSCFLFGRDGLERALGRFEGSYYGWAHTALFLHAISQSQGMVYVQHEPGILAGEMEVAHDKVFLPGEEVEMFIERKLKALRKADIEPVLMKAIEAKMDDEMRRRYPKVLVKSIIARDILGEEAYSKVREHVRGIEESAGYPMWQRVPFALIKGAGEIGLARAVMRRVAGADGYLESIRKYRKGLLRTNKEREGGAY